MRGASPEIDWDPYSERNSSPTSNRRKLAKAFIQAAHKHRLMEEAGDMEKAGGQDNGMRAAYQLKEEVAMEEASGIYKTMNKEAEVLPSVASHGPEEKNAPPPAGAYPPNPTEAPPLCKSLSGDKSTSVDSQSIPQASAMHWLRKAADSNQGLEADGSGVPVRYKSPNAKQLWI